MHESDRKVRIGPLAGAGVPLAPPFVHHHLVAALVKGVLPIVRLSLWQPQVNSHSSTKCVCKLRSYHVIQKGLLYTIGGLGRYYCDSCGALQQHMERLQSAAGLTWYQMAPLIVVFIRGRSCPLYWPDGVPIELVTGPLHLPCPV